jgi:hypothetical protein
MDCPCVDCLCIPSCKQKTYQRIMKCSLLKNYLFIKHETTPTVMFKHRMVIVLKALKRESIYRLD